mgnify:CR=1 FL=1
MTSIDGIDLPRRIKRLQSKEGKVALKGYKRLLDISRRNLVPFKTAFFNYIKKYAKVI